MENRQQPTQNSNSRQPLTSRLLRNLRQTTNTLCGPHSHFRLPHVIIYTVDHASFHTCPYIDRDSLSCDLLQRKSTIFTRPHTRNFFVLEATDETDQAPRHPPLAPSILSHFATCMFLPTASFCFPPLSPILTAILQRRRERENTLIFCFELSRNFLTRFLTV